jgi:prolyl-tRNA editing enzyme YbaK/EbsC (Cys-tRNA(Pro) deacylase)
MCETLSPSAQKVQDALAAAGFPYPVQELEQTTRSAAEAARAVGCAVAQIAKSLVFRGAESGRPVLVIASGPNRVNEARIAAELGEPVERADPDFVREHTGFVIGGVPPLGHPEPLPTFIDADLLKHADIWAAAGTPNAVFRLDPTDLPAMTGGHVVEVK